MTRRIQQLDKRLKGSHQETEDWWDLYKDDAGTLYVVHTWSHTSLRTLKDDTGERRVSAEAFLKEDDPKASQARAALRSYLAELG